MRVGGIDPSSSCSAAALVVNRKLETTDCWKPNKSRTAPQRLADYFVWLMGWLVANEPDIVCVEFLSVERNARSTRVISHYQAISVLCCKLREIPVIEGRVSTARKHALGKGNLAKEDAWQMVKEFFPKHKFKPKTQGGMDETDATVLAIAGPSIAET